MAVYICESKVFVNVNLIIAKTLLFNHSTFLNLTKTLRHMFRSAVPPYPRISSHLINYVFRYLATDSNKEVIYWESWAKLSMPVTHTYSYIRTTHDARRTTHDARRTTHDARRTTHDPHDPHDPQPTRPTPTTYVPRPTTHPPTPLRHLDIS